MIVAILSVATMACLSRPAQCGRASQSKIELERIAGKSGIKRENESGRKNVRLCLSFQAKGVPFISFMLRWFQKF